MNRPLHICIVSEWLDRPDDEGIHNFVKAITISLSRRYYVSSFGPSTGLEDNQLFISNRLRLKLRQADPDFILYISPSCAKPSAFLRAKVLKAYSTRAQVWVIALQPEEYTALQLIMLSWLKPDGIFAQNPSTLNTLLKLGCPVHFLPGGVDIDRFVPAPAEQRECLRHRYNVTQDAYVILHVGHINRNRNVQMLKHAASQAGNQVILVGSTSTPQDDALSQELTNSGIRVICEFLPNIQELYQLADTYLFPVYSKNASIGVPLSVLEAMSCNVPVVTTRFGGLPLMFQESDGFHYFEQANELEAILQNVKTHRNCITRKMVEPYSWDKVTQTMISELKTRNPQ